MPETTLTDLTPKDHSRTAARNWIHLDLKGIIPDETRLLEWLDWLACAGFNGVVWEYEDRLDWRSWPGTVRGGYTPEQWARIWRRCGELQLEVVPLVQTLGHLQWLLKYEPYAAWRENGHLDEVCPQHPAVLPALTGWLDEVIALHPDSTFVNIGGDEPWNLATCPACRARGDKGNVYIEHIAAVAEHVIRRGKRPMIWADAFWTEEGRAHLHRLPPQLVLIDWQYGWLGPTEVTAPIGAAGHELWAASAIRCSHDQTLLVGPICERIKNVSIWRPQAADGRLPGVIHTMWGRTDSMKPLYGPWDAWLPAFLTAGDPELWNAHPLRPLVEEFDWIIAGATVQRERADALIQRLEEAGEADLRTRRCAQWWVLALEHKFLLLRATQLTLGYHGLGAVQATVGTEPETWDTMRANRHKLLADVDVLEQRVRTWWAEGELSDEDEYVAGRFGSIRRLLESWDSGVTTGRAVE